MTTITARPENNLLAGQQSVKEYIVSYIQRLRGGDLGPLPILVGLIIIIDNFQPANPFFLSSRNFVNLILQMTGITVIAYGLVFVLLLGEIDLSVGYVSAVAGVTMTVLLRPPYSFAWYSAVGVALLAVLLIGFIHGILISAFQLPSFIVTLAGLLVWNGVVLIVVGAGGTILIQNAVVRDLASTYIPPDIGRILGAILIIAYALLEYFGWRKRKNSGLRAKPLLILLLQIDLLAVVAWAIITVCNSDRGVPYIGAGLVFMLVILSYLAENTRFGRYVYAVGGNKEAARRAGIRVEQVRVLVFMLASFMAGLGGIVLASRLQSVATNSGGGDLLLNSIAAVVIGGTSLFGGRGKVSSALLGALVIASVENGMVFLGVDASIQFIITGCVLLLAVSVDAISRRGQGRPNLGFVSAVVWSIAALGIVIGLLLTLGKVSFVTAIDKSQDQPRQVYLLVTNGDTGVNALKVKKIEIQQVYDLGQIALVAGLICAIPFIALGFLIRRQFKAALAVAMALLIIEGLIWLVMLTLVRGSIPITLILIVLFLCMLIRQGYAAINDLQKQELQVA